MSTYPTSRIKLDGVTSADGDRDQWLINLAAAHNDLAARHAELQTYALSQGDTVERQGRHIETLQDAVLILQEKVLTLEDAVLTRQEKVLTLEGKIDELERALRTLRSTVADLAATVELATNPNPSRPRDDTNDRIVAYLRDSVPGVWLNPSSIALNLGLSGKSVAGRLDRLARDGKVERTGGKGSGTDPLYRVVPEAVSGAEE